MVSNIIKRKNKVHLYRLGTLVKSLYIFIIIILKEKIVDYVWLIGVMFGISTATTGFPLNIIESEQITNQERIKYLGYKSIATEIISLIIPMLLGAYITVYSYEVAAILVFLFSILKLMLSFFIRNKNVQKTRIDLKAFFEILKKDNVLLKLYVIEFCKGFNRYGVMGLIISLLIIYQTKNDFELGSWTSFFSLIAIITMYIFGKYYHKNDKKKILLMSVFPILISFMFIYFSINKITIIFYNVVYYSFLDIILNITEKDLFDYSNQKLFKNKFNTEYFMFRELFLNVGRVLGYMILLIVVGKTQNLEALKIVFTVCVISVILVICLSRKIEIKQE